MPKNSSIMNKRNPNHKGKIHKAKASNGRRASITEPGVPVLTMSRPVRGITQSVTIVKRGAPIPLYLNGSGITSYPGFNANSTNYGYGISFLTQGCNALSYSFNTASTGLTSTFVDVATFASIYDECRIKRILLDCMISTNAVAPTGGVADTSQIVASPIIQCVYDANSYTPPNTVTTLLGYSNVELWHASTGNSRRVFSFVPHVAPIVASSNPANGAELPSSGWFSSGYYNTSSQGFLKMWFDSESVGGVQGIMTIYPTIEIEFRRQD